MIEPIKPEEADQAKKDSLPDFVIEAFNFMIGSNFHNGRSSFKQSEVVKKIAELGEVNKNAIYENHWLDVEGVYRKIGWKVKYDRPGYNESYEATFEFRK